MHDFHLQRHRAVVEGRAQRKTAAVTKRATFILALAIKQARDMNSLILDRPCAHISSILQIACVLARFDCVPKSIVLKA